MRVIQITDLHVGLPGENTYDVDVRQNFLTILEAMTKLRPDRVVISGDLCYRVAEPEVYQWIKDRMDQLGIPYSLISGNHDDPRVLARVFARERLLQEGELFFAEQWGNWPVLFLDTTTGNVSELQLNWLRQQLQHQQGNLLLFMHHPPLLAGVPFMDNRHALKNRKAVMDVLVEYPDQINIFSGHYHVEKVIRYKNVLVHLTPSCFVQIDQHCEEFKVDHLRIGLREIKLNGEVLMSTVHYYA